MSLGMEVRHTYMEVSVKFDVRKQCNAMQCSVFVMDISLMCGLDASIIVP